MKKMAATTIYTCKYDQFWNFRVFSGPFHETRPLGHPVSDGSGININIVDVAELSREVSQPSILNCVHST